MELLNCGHPAQKNGVFAGYAVKGKNEKICYDCCAELDAQYLRENGKLSGYLVKKGSALFFTNWPGTFSLPVFRSSQSWHNFAGRNGRTDFWVMFEGRTYHGYQIGHNNQCATIRAKKIIHPGATAHK